MIIGIDIDDTVAKTNDRMIEEAVIYDRNYVKGKGFKNKDAYSFMEMFYWNVLDVDGFLDYIRNSKFFLEIDPIDGAVEYVNKLHEDGYKIVFITKRKNNFKSKSMTKKWLKMHGFKFNKIILGANKKGPICEKEKLSLFIDNDLKNVLDAKEHGVNAILMKDDYNKGKDGVKVVSSWKEVYKYVSGVKEDGEIS